MSQFPTFRRDLKISNLEADTYLIKDPVSQKFFRLSDFELRLLSQLDGNTDLETAISNLKYEGFQYNPEDAKMVLARASGAGLILGTNYGTAEFQSALNQKLMDAKRIRNISSVYFLFIPILNPDKILERTIGLARFVGKWLLLIAMLLSPGALYLIIDGLPKIKTEYLFFFNVENILYLWITLAVTKLIHEFAHAYTAKSFGLSVPQMGVGFLIFFPCLYCNTTEAWQLGDRRQRMLISAAGIAAEAVMAIFATYCWHYTKPGVINSLAFYLMAISFISTVLFNGNPLLKFDGYFILMDYLKIPNLASKSFGYIKYLFLNGALGISLIPNTAADSRESVIFSVYGISAIIYRFFLYFGIIATVYYRFDKTIGILLAVLAIGLFLVRPLIRGFIMIYKQKSEIRFRPVGLVCCLLLLIGLGLFLFVPVAGNSVYPCYVTGARLQKMTVPLQTLVSNMYIREGSRLSAGEPLFTLDPSLLKLTLSQKEFEREAALKEMEMWLLDEKRMPEAGKKQSEYLKLCQDVEYVEGELRKADSDNIAPFNGIVTKLDKRMQPGFMPGEGAVVGEFQSSDDCVIHALVPGRDIHKVNLGGSVDVWLPLGTGLTLSRKVDRVRNWSETDLKDSPFSSRFGGELATEATGDQDKDVPLDDYFICSSYFVNSARIPLGLTGRYVIPTPPQSRISRYIDGLYSLFHRESVL